MLTLEKFEEATEVVKKVILETKLVYSDYLTEQTGNKVYLKPENMQLTGAYKIRGAYYKISTLTDEQRKRNEILSLEKMLSVVSEKIEMVLNGKSEKSEISTIQDYLYYLKNCSDWKGIYWNKTAVTSISNRFFMNWYDVTDKLQTIKSCATFDKKREEQQ